MGEGIVSPPMSLLSLVAVAMCCLAAALPAPSEWRVIPGGYRMHSACLHEASNGALIDSLDARDYNNTSCRIEAPLIQIYAADVHEGTPAGKSGFTSLTADFEVPPVPTEQSGQVVYFWPGFKSVQPEMGYPVIQPVLQYGESHFGKPSWQLQSWFVDAKSRFWHPVVTAPAITVHPGDKITTSMVLEGDMWTISGVDESTGENSTLKVSKRRAGNCEYNYAMLVNENINVDTRCHRMPPTKGVTFSNVSLDGATPKWTTRANCNGNSACDCGNSATVAATGEVTLGWNADKQQ